MTVGWWPYVSTAAGFLFTLIVLFNGLSAYNKWQERLAVERIEAYLHYRFGARKERGAR